MGTAYLCPFLINVRDLCPTIGVSGIQSLYGCMHEEWIRITPTGHTPDIWIYQQTFVVSTSHHTFGCNTAKIKGQIRIQNPCERMCPCTY